VQKGGPSISHFTTVVEKKLLCFPSITWVESHLRRPSSAGRHGLDRGPQEEPVRRSKKEAQGSKGQRVVICPHPGMIPRKSVAARKEKVLGRPRKLPVRGAARAVLSGSDHARPAKGGNRISSGSTGTGRRGENKTASPYRSICLTLCEHPRPQEPSQGRHNYQIRKSGRKGKKTIGDPMAGISVGFVRQDLNTNPT